MHLPHRLHPVHARHPPIHQHQVIGQVLALGLHQHRQGHSATVGHIHLDPEAAGHAVQDLAGAGVVVDHQRPHTAQLVQGKHAPWQQIVLAAKDGRKMEGRAEPRHAVHPDTPAHQLDQAFGDGQPQPGAPVFAGDRAVGLAKGLEYPLALFGAHANAGIAHPEMQLQLVTLIAEQLGTDHYLAALGELHGIVAKVDQDLPQPQRIPHQRGRQVDGGVEQQLEALVLGTQAYHVGKIIQHILQMERDQLQIHLAGFDLREVEDVVDDAEQVLRRAMHLLDVVALTTIQLCTQRQMAHTDDGVHRGADLVAHIGEEGTLGLGCLLRDRPRLGQRRDVDIDPGCPQRRPFRGAGEATQGLEGAHSTVPLSLNTKIDLESVIAVGDRRLEGRARKHRIVGVQQRLPVIQGAAEATRFQPEHVLQLGRPISAVSGEIDIEQTYAASLLRQRQALAGHAQPGPQRPALTDIPHRGTDTGATPGQSGQVGQADLHGEQAAILAHPLQIFDARPHLASAAVSDEVITPRHMGATAALRYQTLDGLTDQLAAGIAEQLVQLRIGQQDEAIGSDHQHAVWRRLYNAAIPCLGGPQRRLLHLQFYRLTLQLQGLCPHLVGLAPGLL
ncbi:hypothetical protein D3C79_605510 [compost metagenome]